MIVQGLITAAVLVLPQLAHAANLGPFADITPYAMAAVGAAYLGAGIETTWYGKKALSAYRHRDTDGMNAVWENLAVAGIGGVAIGVIIPRLTGPIMALGATLQ